MPMSNADILTAATLVPIQIEHFGFLNPKISLSNKNPLPMCSSKGCFPLLRRQILYEYVPCSIYISIYL